MKKFFSKFQKEKTANTICPSYYKSVVQLVIRYYSADDQQSIYIIGHTVESRDMENFKITKEKRIAEMRQTISDIKIALNAPDDFLLISDSLIINKKKFINAAIETDGD